MRLDVIDEVYCILTANRRLSVARCLDEKPEKEGQCG
jgi:hypothetical protein